MLKEAQDKEGVCNKIALKEPFGLTGESVEPFQAIFLHPGWRLLE